jgi:hypothetical protein
VVAKTGDTPTLETASWAQDIEVQWRFPDDPHL